MNQKSSQAETSSAVDRTQLSGTKSGPKSGPKSGAQHHSAREARVRAKYGIWGSDAPLSQPQFTAETEQECGDKDRLNRSVLFYYLVPVVGFFPSLWTLYRRRGTKEQAIVSRLSVTLAFGWMLGHLLLQTGAHNTAESIALPLLLMSSVLTSSYFTVSIWLMIRLWQRRPLKIPGISDVADRFVGRHL